MQEVIAPSYYSHEDDSDHEATEPRYDFGHEQIHDLSKEFLETRELKPDSQFGCYAIDGSNKYSNLGRYVESTVFLDAFGNTPNLMANEYGPYENSSEFFVVMDHESEMPVGVLRTIRNSEAGLKSLNDLKETPLQLDAGEICDKYDIDPNRCIDVGTLAIIPEFRTRVGNILPSLLLYRTLYLRYLNNPAFDHVVTIIDKKAEKNLYRLGFPFKPIDERYFTYIDSTESRALYGVNNEFYPSVEKHRKELLEESEKDGGSIKGFYAEGLDGLAHGTHIDAMLGFPIPQEVKH